MGRRLTPYNGEPNLAPATSLWTKWEKASHAKFKSSERPFGRFEPASRRRGSRRAL